MLEEKNALRAQGCQVQLKMSADTDSLGFRRFMNKLHPIILFYIFWQADDENYASFIILYVFLKFVRQLAAENLLYTLAR